MRLIATQSLELHEFHGSQIPDYAILSHRWGPNEVSFEDLRNRNRESSRTIIISRDRIQEEVIIYDMPGQADESSQGWQKIRGCCALAARKGYEYVWIDTCCINRESSAELTEAINSMYHWYKVAGMCFAYLSDVPSAADDPRAPASAFRQSVWFTRSWTLQEMIAPRLLEFYSADWNLIGTRTTLSEVIGELTGVPSSQSEWRSCCIAEKMSWASRRVCERPEDKAYSLLGIFGIYMPLLYGEGRNAFSRLQLEIIKQSDDESIFAWTHDPFKRCDWYASALLAISPRAFAGSGGIHRHNFVSRSHYSMTNKGLHIETAVIDTPKEPNKTWRAHRKVIYLNCCSSRAQDAPFPLFVLPLVGTDNEYWRIMSQEAVEPGRWKDIWHDAIKQSQSQHFSQANKMSIYISHLNLPPVTFMSQWRL